MRILLDECLPRRLKMLLPGHDVYIKGLSNARGASAERLTVVVLTARSNRLADLGPLIPEVMDTLLLADAGATIRIPRSER